MNERIKELRLILGVSQEDFGLRIGVTRASISNLEKGIRNPSDQTIKSICREFNVNYAWLVDGIGEIFSDMPKTLFEEVANEYDLDELDKLIVKKYIQLPPAKREIFKEYLKSVLEEMGSE